MELARQCHDSQFLLLAVRSLSKAQEKSPIQLPFVSLLVAQAQGSLCSKEKWETNLRLEWFAWSPGWFLSEICIVAMHETLFPHLFGFKNKR